MAGVQRARHVRRRVRDDKGLPRVSWLSRVEALLLPGLLPALFDAFGVVARVHHSPEPTFIRRSRVRMWSGSDYASSICAPCAQPDEKACLEAGCVALRRRRRLRHRRVASLLGFLAGGFSGALGAADLPPRHHRSPGAANENALPRSGWF